MCTSVQISESSPEKQEKKKRHLYRGHSKNLDALMKSHVQFQYWVNMSNGICLKVPEKSPGEVTVGEESTV